MVLLVVVLHAAISYGKFVPWWFVKDAGSSVFFDILMLTLDSFLMPVLYFIHYMVRPYPRQFIAGLYGLFIVIMISG